MKKMTLAALVLVGILAAGNALAATANLDVTAKVTAACQITGGDLDFEDLDPLNPTPVTKTSVGVTVTCNTNESYSIIDDKGGVYNLSDGLGNTIAYNLTYPTLSLGDGTAQEILITGNIAAVAYDGKPSGTYSDTVVLTVTP